MDSNSASGAFMAGQRTVISRELYERLIAALLEGDEDQRIAAAAALAADAPSWWAGPTRHGVRARQGAAQ